MMIKVNGAELCAETFGDRGDPPILLISGAAGSMDWWDGEFCRRLASAGRFVIRYDHRDTGQSTSYEAGKPGYTGLDLSEDPLRVLDALAIRAAHVAGVSMGGGIAQRIVMQHPDRVASLTLISTSPIGATGRELPPPQERIGGYQPAVDWDDREAVIEYFVEAEKVYGGSIPVDEARIRTIAGQVFDRTADMRASQNHWILEDGGEPVRWCPGEMSVPVLVIHGTEDPLFPLPHGEALAAEFPGAVLVTVERMGHQMPPPEVWPVIIPAMVRISA